MDSGLKKAAGKVVIITGASSGAGRAIANEFAKQGAQLVLAARRHEALEEVAAECTALGGHTIVVPTDTTDVAALHQLAKAAVDFGGRIDVWINNAGVLAAGLLEEIPSEVNEQVIKTNLLGYIYGAYAVLPYFKQQGYGLLVNNISVGGWFPTPFMAAYCASKFGLRGFSESLKGELRPYPDIHVCDLYPPFLDTPGMQHAANYTGKQLTPAPPLSDPRELARAVVALLHHPRSAISLGPFSVFLHLAYGLFPALSRNITAALIRNYLKQATKTEHTSGNVLHTVEYGTGIDGGWRTTSLKPSPRKKVFLLAGLVTGLVLLAKSRR